MQNFTDGIREESREKGYKMNKSPYIQRSSEITKIGRLEIQLCLKTKYISCNYSDISRIKRILFL